ncbi:hypothetical protein [Psychromonas aquimarina]|uniref:hypothetical protein n=1 Tax=Psychromonas aquimarina TaxID=444919 RepID=UPI00048B3498|nr:hypothetical protein [Psychromonas aquimarina]
MEHANCKDLAHFKPYTGNFKGINAGRADLFNVIVKNMGSGAFNPQYFVTFGLISQINQCFTILAKKRKNDLCKYDVLFAEQVLASRNFKEFVS